MSHPILRAAAIGGAVLFLVGQALLPAMPTDIGPAFAEMVEHRDQLLASRLLSAAGAFLLVAGVVVFGRALAPGTRGAGLLRGAAAVFGVATFSNALSQAVAGYATYAVTEPGLDEESARHVVEHLGTGLVGIPIGFWSIPVFALACIAMAVALLRSRTVPVWLPVVLIIGTVLAGALAGRGPSVALTQLPVTVALIALALRENRSVRHPERSIMEVR